VTQTFLEGLLTSTLVVTLKLALPTLVAGLGVGLVVSVLQAVTQIQEMTLTFVPKIVATVLALIFFGPWMLRLLIGFTIQLYAKIPELAR